MSGGGAGNVLSTGASLAAGQSPLGAFGGALGSQLLSGGGGGGSGAGAPAGGIGGIGRQNQTQLVGPMAGVNPASPAYNIMMQQQARPQVLPQVTPQVTPQVPMQTSQLGSQIQSLLNTPGQVGQAPFQAPNGNFGVSGEPTQSYMQGPMRDNRFPIQFDTFNRPQTLPPQGGFPGRLGGAPDLSQDAYRRHLATAFYRSQADIPSYDQWVQQSSAPKPMPQVQPMPRPGPQVQPIRRPLPMPVGQPAMGGLAGLANMLKGTQ